MSYKTHNRPGPSTGAALVPTLNREEMARRCANGQHDVVRARPGYVTYLGGRRVEPGTRYCRACHAAFGGPDV